MGAGEWITIVAISIGACGTIIGATIAIRVQIARLETAVQYLSETLKDFKQSVDDEHREMWRAINRRRKRERDEECE